jgi:hypothetical protein
LITDSSQARRWTDVEIRSPEIQRHVLDLVCRREHDVKRLIDSIKEMGFVGGLHEIIVKDVGPGGPYLVIEGNRRTAALRYLLDHGNGLHPDVRESIERIEVKLFTYRRGSEDDEQTVIEALLGRIHIDGPKEWGALERVHYIFRAYVRALGESIAFRYERDIARAVGSTFKMSPKAVHKCLTICRVYEQLRRAEVDVEPKHYTLIDLATKTRAVAEPYFELDRVACELSQVGLERFVQLVLRPDAPVHNPKLFNAFVYVFADGTEAEREDVVSGEKSLEVVRAAIERRRERRGFRNDLEAIKLQIQALYVDDFRGTEGERTLIRGIQKLVERRLIPLLETGA